jgi:hypothetical protein
VQAVDLLLRHGALRQQLLAVLRVRVLIVTADTVLNKDILCSIVIMFLKIFQRYFKGF